MKIGIITINYNNLQGLMKTMNSTLEQSYDNKEYIIIDGGSTDGSCEYIASHCEKLHYWISEKDNGLYHAMNKGIEQSNADYLIFMNSGDIFYNNKVLHDLFEEKIYNADILYGSTIYDYPGGGILRLPRDLKIMERELPFCHQSCFVNGNLMRKKKFDESYRIISDYAFFYQCYKENKIFQKTDIIISVYDTNGLSANSDNLKIMYIERCKILKKKINLTEHYIEQSIRKFKDLIKYFFLKKINNYLIKTGAIKLKFINKFDQKI